METTSDDTKADDNTITKFKMQRVADALFVGFDDRGRLRISDVDTEKLGLIDVQAVTVDATNVEAFRRAVGTPGVWVGGGPTEESLRALHARIDSLVDGRGEAMRLLADRMEALEKRVQTNYDYVTQRMNKTDETVGLNFRSNREEHNQIAVQLNGDSTEQNPGIKTQIAQLAMLTDAINTAQENLQELVEKMAPGSLKVPELPANIATKEYVDAATHRLSAALREHIGNVITDAIRLARPAPGLARRLLNALRNEIPAGVERQRTRGGLDPDHAASLGARAARASSED